MRRRPPLRWGGVALGPKGIACVHTYAHIRREAESDGGTRVRMRKCARTYVRIERAPSLPLGCARAYNARTYRRACVRATGAGTCAGTHAPYVRTQGEHGKHVRRHAARPHAQTHATTPGREEEGAIWRQRPNPPLPSAAARPSTLKKSRGLRVAFPCKSSPQDFLPQQACPTAAEAEAASAKSLADGLFFAGTRQSTSESTSMGAGGAGSSACRRSGSSGGQLP